MVFCLVGTSCVQDFYTRLETAQGGGLTFTCIEMNDYSKKIVLFCFLWELWATPCLLIAHCQKNHSMRTSFSFAFYKAYHKDKARQVTYQKIKLADVDMTWRPTYYPGGVLLLIMIVLLLVNVSSSLLWTEHVRLTNYKKKWWENDGKPSQNQMAPSFL